MPKIINAHYKEIVFHIPEGYTIEHWIERAGRTCYKSEDKITEESAPKFVRMLHKRGHHAMLEHAVISAIIIGDRGLTHELVRHRLASFAQESTRYCNYSKGKFSGEITIIEIPDITNPSPELLQHWHDHALACEKAYFKALDLGARPEIARMWLPIGLKAEIVITANLREWSHIFSLRCNTPAHPIIRGVCLEILNKLNDRLPSMYEDQAKKFLTD